jgi:hypothetical protein
MGDKKIGCLIFNRTEATRCYSGALTYGSMNDVLDGRAKYSRWEILSLARVWLSPDVQVGGCLYSELPGYRDRKGTWRSTLASTVIGMALERIVFDYLFTYPPVWIDQPYRIRVVTSYCDTRIHRGTIYRASGFRLVRTNKDGIETWMRLTRPLSSFEDEQIGRLAQRALRSRMMRSKADGMGIQQETMF